MNDADKPLTLLPPLLPVVEEARRLLVIFNPTSGRASRSERRLRRVLDELERLGCSVALRRTEARGDAERLAREAELDIDIVVAAGGDGTINEVANGLGGAPRRLAVIPLGTANVLANEIGLPRDPRRLAAIIAAGRARPVWPGRVGGRLFLMMVGVGFDAAVLRRVDPALKRRIGKLAFFWPLLRALWRYRPGQLVLRSGGAEHRAFSAVIARGHFYAGRFVLAPAARLEEPLLHVVMLRQGGRWAMLRLSAAVGLGLAHRLPEVAIATGRSLSIAGPAPTPVEIDGDLAGGLPLAFELAATPLLLVQPG